MRRKQLIQRSAGTPSENLHLRGWRLIWNCIFLVSLFTNCQAGRGDKSGTAAASELLIPVGARAIALGSSSLATVSGIEATYWNPAGLARSNHPTDATFSHMNYLAGIHVEYLGLGFPIGDFGRAGITVKSVSFGDVHVTTEDEPDGTGEVTSPLFLIVGGSFARDISDRIRIGLTSNLIIERMARVSTTDVAFNAGVQYSGLGGIEGLSVGVVVKNLGPPLRFSGPGLLRTAQIFDASRVSSTVMIEAASAELPSTIEIGLGYTITLSERGIATISSTFQNNNFSEDEYKTGIEYAYSDQLFLRGGYTFASEGEGREYIFGPSGGFGVRTMVGSVEVSFDYGYRSVTYFSGNHVFSLGLGIN